MAIPDNFCKGFSLEVGVLRDKIKRLSDLDIENSQGRLLHELAHSVYVLSKRVEELTED